MIEMRKFLKIMYLKFYFTTLNEMLLVFGHDDHAVRIDEELNLPLVHDTKDLHRNCQILKLQFHKYSIKITEVIYLLAQLILENCVGYYCKYYHKLAQLLLIMVFNFVVEDPDECVVF
jgi:hypothetical protein